MDLKKLEAMKAKIEEAKDTKARAEGALEPLMKQLEEEFGCKTVEEARKKLKKMQSEIEIAEEEIEEKIVELEKKMEE
jgi:predicted  nucleic acid-binding Zn-ribbon protein